MPQREITTTASGELVEFCEAVAAAGFDHVLFYDHVLGADTASRPGWSGVYSLTDPFLEPLVTFGYLAQATTLDFMTGVLVLPQRQTVLVAKQVATLEALAPGRLRLGVGIGWNEVEYEALGKDFANRGRRLDEQIVLLRRLLREPVVDFRGEHERVDRAGLRPRPAVDVPIWLGSGPSPRALRRVGELADGWLPTPTLVPGPGLNAAWEQVQAAALACGRDPEAIEMEGHIRLRGGGPRQAGLLTESWRAAGAHAVVIDLLGLGAEWPQGHIGLVETIGAVLD